MKSYTFKNEFGQFMIADLGNRFIVSGDIRAAQHEFKKIHRQPPNKYGNFPGREKAGFAACRELICTLAVK